MEIPGLNLRTLKDDRPGADSSDWLAVAGLESQAIQA